MQLHVGCPMWAHRPWQGRVLPEGLDRQGQLRAYATWCNAVEGNTTFYGVPSAATVRSWAEATPSSFRFMFKLPKRITHELRLRGDAAAEARAFVELLEPLGPRIDPIAVQLAGSFGPTALGDLARFLAALPSSRRYAVEVRHPAFFDGSRAATALTRLLHDHDAEWIGFDTETLFESPPADDAERDSWNSKPRVPRRTEAITDRPVVRFIGRSEVARTVLGWQRWKPVLADWLHEGRRPTFFLHTPDNADALVLARRFHDEMRALVPELEPLPEPEVPVPTTLF